MLDYEGYIKDLPHRFKVTDCNAVVTPTDPNHQPRTKEMCPNTDELVAIVYLGIIKAYLQLRLGLDILKQLYKEYSLPC